MSLSLKHEVTTPCTLVKADILIPSPHPFTFTFIMVPTPPQIYLCPRVHPSPRQLSAGTTKTSSICLALFLFHYTTKTFVFHLY